MTSDYLPSSQIKRSRMTTPPLFLLTRTYVYVVHTQTHTPSSNKSTFTAQIKDRYRLSSSEYEYRAWGASSDIMHCKHRSLFVLKNEKDFA